MAAVSGAVVAADVTLWCAGAARAAWLQAPTPATPCSAPALAQVDFAGVGQLLRNRAGRIEFVFDPQLVEAMELGVRPVRAAVHSF